MRERQMHVRKYLVERFSRGTQERADSETNTDLKVALRLFHLNWIVIAVILVAFVMSVLLTDFRLQPEGYLLLLGMGGLYGLFGHLNATSERRANPRVYHTLFSFAQMLLLVVLLTSMGFVAASANLPMQDTNLLAFDRSLGLEFRAYLDFVNERPRLIHVLAITYASIRWQLLVIAIFLPLIGYYRRTAEFMFGFGIALIATTAISTLMPATGVYGTLGLKPEDLKNLEPTCYYITLRELPLVRDGTTRLLDAFELGPILTFPSFHAISAVLYGWAFWPIRWFRAASFVWNAVMVAATPIGGGHYFADVFLGVVVAALSIYGVKLIGAAITQCEKPAPDASLQVLAAASPASSG